MANKIWAIYINIPITELFQIKIPTHETVKPTPAFDETAIARLNEDVSVFSESYISHMHFAPVTKPEIDPKIIAEVYVLQVPKVLKRKFSSLRSLQRFIGQLIIYVDINIKGNTDEIRVFTQKFIEFAILSEINFTFVKIKIYTEISIVILKIFLNLKSYYYPFKNINISSRKYIYGVKVK